MDYGGSVVLGNLDDFIAPSQACVNPIFTQPKDGESAAATEIGVAKIAIESDDVLAPATTVKPDLIKSSSGNTAQVSLSDCLACSGCVTSAETVLVENQSRSKFLADLQSPLFKLRFISVSPAAHASLATALHLPAQDASDRITSFFRSLGVHCVFDCGGAHNVALVEAREDFLQRYRQQNQSLSNSGAAEQAPTVDANASAADDDAASATAPRRKRRAAGRRSGQAKKKLVWERPPVTKSTSAEEIVDAQGNPVVVIDDDDDDAQRHLSTLLPVLTSECPGWICYAEKRHPESLPYISTVKSAQEIMGTFLKFALASKLGVAEADVYHAAVMPCFDKKLEASRRDFYHTATTDKRPVQEVDLVLTAAEVLDMMKEQEVSKVNKESETRAAAGAQADTGALGPAESILDAHSQLLPLPGTLGQPVGAGAAGPSLSHGGSGGYAEYIFRQAALDLFDVDLGPDPLNFIEGKNRDWKELELEVNGKVVLRFALAYGFRNIQKVMRDIKRSRVNYDFVEVMACPSGCLNGGGQAKPQGDAPASTPAPAPAAKASPQTAVSEGGGGGSKSLSTTPVLPAPSIAARRAELTAAVASSLSEAWCQRQRPSSSKEDAQVAGVGSGNEEEESPARSGAPDDDPFTKSVYAWMPSGGSPGSSAVRRWLHTRYHTVPKMEEANPLGIRW